MWVSQTYLGTVEPDAKLFVYYLFEDYSREQREFTEQVQMKLEEAGEILQGSVSLLMPNPRYAVRIEAEIRGLQEFWWMLKGRLPGLLISTKPLTEFDPRDGEYFLVPFVGKDTRGAAEAVARVRAIADQHLSFEHEHRASKPRATPWQRLLDAIEIKLGFGGVKLDLKRLARSASERNSRWPHA